MAPSGFRRIAVAAALVAAAGTLTTSAHAAPARPDLGVSQVGAPTKPVRAGDTVALTFKVRNAGRTKAAASTLAFHLSANAKRDAADVPLGTAKVKALARRKTQSGTARLRIPPSARPGTWTLIACADDRAKVRERSERNNCRAGGKVRVVAGGAAPKPGTPPSRPSPATAAVVPGPTGPGTGTPDPGPGGGQQQPGPGEQPDPPPPDPGAVAPDLPEGQATAPYDAMKFLFTGPSPIQRGVAAGTIDDEKIAVLRGRVLDRARVPIAGVRVTVVDRPEFGRTQTRADGRFDLAVNGADLVLAFEAAGFLTAQRKIDPGWEDVDALEDVVMVPVDETVTRIAKASTEPFQVAQGSQVDDHDGARRGTLLFPRGTTATMRLPDGSRKELGDLDVRITEFTVGDGGDSAMPGTLPATTGYTYAAEFSVDEALKARATQVDFSAPVLNYTQNFIGAPVGTNVPTGYYDRTDGVWKPGADGRVLKITGIGDGKAIVEGADGLNLSDDERRVLAQRFPIGAELWRVPLDHFTPWDHNWPFGPPPGARPPKLKEFEWKDPNDPCRQEGSTIGCETGTLAEHVPVTGTPHALTYANDRTLGWKVDEVLKVPITDSVLPPRLKGIDLQVDIAGQRMTKRWCDDNYPTTGGGTCDGLPPVTPNLTYDFTWDGRDAYGRPTTGRQKATIRVIYVYEFNYYPTPEDFDSSFAAFPPSDTEFFDGRGSCGNVAGTMENHFFCGIPVGQTITRMVGSWDARESEGLGGWTLSSHHTYDPGNGVVMLGDGTQHRSDAIGPLTRTIAGGDGPLMGDPEADGKDAREVDPDYTDAITRGPDGSTYLSVWFNETGVFRVGPDGKLRRFAGLYSTNPNETQKRAEERGPASGDGGPATQARLGGPVKAMTVAPDGSLYLAVEAAWPRALIRRVSPDGRISTVAGTTDTTVPWRDGVRGTQTRIGDVNTLHAAADGTLYWAERGVPVNDYKGRVRRLNAAGVVETVAGGGADNTADDQDLGNGEPAREAEFQSALGLTTAADGSLWFTLPLEGKVVRVAQDGRIRRMAGAGGDPAAAPDYARPALEVQLGAPTALAIGPDGQTYIRHDHPRTPSRALISELKPDGTLRPAAGRTRGNCGFSLSTDGEPALGTCIEGGYGLTVDADGTLHYQDGRYQVRRIEAPLSGFGARSHAIPSPDGAEVWEFDANGRHLRTLDGLTGALQRRFEYDGAGRLTGEVDGDGRRTTVERDAAGTPTAIVAPGGQRTTLALDGAGYLERITNPAGEAHRMTYHPRGLLATFTNPADGVSTLTYDGTGRLTRDVDADGVVTTLVRTEDENGVTSHVEVGGRRTTYKAEIHPNGDKVREVVQPGNRVTRLVQHPDGLRERIAPDGTLTSFESGPDPRWGARVTVPVREVTKTPAGIERERAWRRTAQLADPLNPLSVTQLSVTHDDGDRGGVTWTYDAAERTATTETAENRTVRSTLDARGRVVEVEPGSGVAPITLDYDARGRVAKRTQGDTATTYTYDTRDRLIRRADASGDWAEWSYDAADRISELRLPGNATYRYTNRPDGGRTIRTPEGREYEQDNTADGRPSSLSMPGVAGDYVSAYEPGRELDKQTLPSGAVDDHSYDAAGQLTGSVNPQARRLFGYADGTGQWDETLAERTGGGGRQTLDLDFDGVLPTRSQFGGAATGDVATVWGEGMLPTHQEHSLGGTTTSAQLAFDDDRLLERVGALTFQRRGTGGALTGVANAGDAMALTLTQDTLARLKDKKLVMGGATRFSEAVTYDRAGRVASTTIGGAARLYEYDARGQLKRVRAGSATGSVVEEYGYDGDGNRTSAAYDGQSAQPATYAAATGDLAARGGTAYEFDADGYLTRRGSDTFTYSRDGLLVAATVGGQSIEYDHDAFGRRTARRAGGQTERWLYGDAQNMLRVTAYQDASGTWSVLRYDGNGALVMIERGGSRFYVGTDHLGSPRVVTDSAGAVVKTVEHDAFGRVTAQTGTFALPLGYAGGIADAATGLVRFGRRDYEPASGRWTARDPSLFAGSPQNLYAYVGSNPATFVDPTGLACGGFGAYGGAGGAIQLCRDNDLSKNEWSFCAEIGVGVGGGWEIDATGGAADTGGSMVAELTGKLGPGSVTLGGEMDLNCFNTKGSVKGQLGHFTASVDTSGSPGWGSAPADDVGWGGKAEGKVAWKQCARFGLF